MYNIFIYIGHTILMFLTKYLEIGKSLLSDKPLDSVRDIWSSKNPFNFFFVVAPVVRTIWLFNNRAFKRFHYVNPFRKTRLYHVYLCLFSSSCALYLNSNVVPFHRSCALYFYFLELIRHILQNHISNRYRYSIFIFLL